MSSEIPVSPAFRRRLAPAGAVSTRHDGWGAARRAAEEDRLRLVAALLVLGALLVWILFLQG